MAPVSATLFRGVVIAIFNELINNRLGLHIYQELAEPGWSIALYRALGDGVLLLLSSTVG